MRFESYIIPVIVLSILITVANLTVMVGDFTKKDEREKSVLVNGAERKSIFENIHQQSARASNIFFQDEYLAQWSFDDGEGTILVDEGNGDGIGVLKGSPTWVSGKKQSALFFDGVDDYLEVENNILSRGNSFSFLAWVMPQGNVQRVLLSEEDGDGSADGTYNISLGNGKLSFSIVGYAGLSVTSTLVQPDKWVHIAVIYDAEASPNAFFYVDGKNVLRSTVVAPRKGDTTLLIGRSKDEYFNGRLDEVQIYNRALTGEEVKEVLSEYSDKEIVSDPIPFSPFLIAFSEVGKLLQAGIGFLFR